MYKGMVTSLEVCGMSVWLTKILSRKEPIAIAVHISAIKIIHKSENLICHTWCLLSIHKAQSDSLLLLVPLCETSTRHASSRPVATFSDCNWVVVICLSFSITILCQRKKNTTSRLELSNTSGNGHTKCLR